jgi:hemerythrin superfamily protein
LFIPTHTAGTTTSTSNKDILEVLTNGHSEALDLLNQIQHSQDPEKKRILANTVITELVKHSIVEEALVYPLLAKKLPDGSEVTKHDADKHHQLAEIMRHLEKANAELPEFTATAKRLAQALDHHR